MSVMVTVRVPGDGEKLEKFASEQPDVIKGIVERAKGYGVISHKFWAHDGVIVVVDEWPDESSFRTFFDASPDIADVMQAAGATGPPEIEIWRSLATGDEM